MIYTDTLTVVDCCVCFVNFGMPKNMDEKLRESHEYFYCPQGHRQHYTSKSDLEIERNRRIAAEAAKARAEDQAEVAERRRRAAKGQLTKMKNRIANGVCPWCNRSFANVLAHVETQHPEHVEEARASTG